MAKFSVKQPFTVLVAVLICIILGVVSLTRMTTDLLPTMSLPYMIVITPYPGASPDRVESEVGEPLEAALGTVTNVKQVTSVAAENYSMIQLEFEDGTDMDSAMVKVSGSVNQVKANLPDSVGTPSIMEISMNMIATMYLAVNKEGADIYDLSDYVNTEVSPYFERVDGIASVSTVGLVEQSVQVELNQRKIDSVNDRILEKTNSALRDARNQLEDAKSQVEEAQDALKEQEESFGSQMAEGIMEQIDVETVRTELQNGVADAIYQLELLAWEIEAAELGIDQSLIGSAEIVQGAVDGAAQAAQDAAGAMGDSLTPSVSVNGFGDYANTGGGSAIAGGAAVYQYFANQNIQSRIASLISELSYAESLIQNSDTYAGMGEGISYLISVGGDITYLTAMLTQADVSGVLTDPLEEVSSALGNLYVGAGQLPALMDGLEEGLGAIFQGQLTAAVAFSTAATQLSTAQTQLESALAAYNTQRSAALENANINALVSASTLSQLIYAQNFSMPAGYIDDESDESWLLKVGDEFASDVELNDTLLLDIDEIGTIRISDIADVTVIDNADTAYTKLNGEPAVILALYKGSTAGTNEVSRAANAAIESLQGQGEGLHIVTLMDQGIYITQIVQDILSSMILGALLAIIVLALFLRDIRPTIIVGISIPLSVLFTIVLMYFSGLTMNIMTLGGLSLGIGMLVDNSIVVMENIIRLRQRGMKAGRAAVQGTKQVGGAIFASTLTTICVFLPMIFTTGTVRELLLPMALSITYCLTASLIVAMTVVPSSASVILRRARKKKSGIFDRVLDRYEILVARVLSHKIVALSIAVVLLAVSVIRLVTMGIVILPDMTSDTVQITITTPHEDDRSTSYEQVDQILEAVLSVPGVTDVGAMDSSATAGLVSSVAGSTDTYGEYVVYVSLGEGVDLKDMDDTIDAIEEATGSFEAEVLVSTGGMSDLSAMTGSGLSLNLYGTNEEILTDISEQLMAEIEKIDGFENISNGSEDNQDALHLVIDKDKAMSYGLTVAQIYAEIASRLATEVTSTTITNGDTSLEVIIKDETDPLTRENILNLEFDTSQTMSMMDGTGNSDALSSEYSDVSSLAAAASDGGEDSGEEDGDTNQEEDTIVTLGEFATLEETTSPSSINRENQKRYLTVTADTKEGYNTTLLSRELEGQVKELSEELPEGYSIEFSGETTEVNEMVTQMSQMLLLALAFIYFVMVAQFQSLLSPFIILFTIPLAFTGGMIGLILTGEPLSMMALMGFLVLMGTVVNNGIVFVDYTNQLRKGGMTRRAALIATGRTRMRPILMTTLTTVLAMTQLIFGSGMGSQLSKGMAIVIVGGLIYATLMTLFIIPCMYDIFYKKQPLDVDVGDDLDDVPDDAAEFLQEMGNGKEKEK